MGFIKYSFLKGTSRMLDAFEAALKKECVPKYVKQNKYFFLTGFWDSSLSASFETERIH